jgi:hypothetical protein
MSAAEKATTREDRSRHLRLLNVAPITLLLSRPERSLSHRIAKSASRARLRPDHARTLQLFRLMLEETPEDPESARLCSDSRPLPQRDNWNYRAVLY